MHEQEQTETAVIGAGIIGLFNALQLAKRGIQVTLIDDLIHQKKSYKVGESLLVFSNAFLRTIGGLDEFIEKRSVPKLGVWFSYGLEGQYGFEETTEWAIERTLPEWLEQNFDDKFLFRAGVADAQIVRPEAEEEMARQARAHPKVRFLDAAKVRDVQIDRTGGFHELKLEDRSSKAPFSLRARWVIDCSGRARLLARRLGHQIEAAEIAQDGFQTTAVWAQFSGIRKEAFGEIWKYRFPDGGIASRNRCTGHLWGAGYWIWVINLSEDRISIGVTFNQSAPPPGRDFQEQFWNVVRRYPVFEGMLLKENVLEFRVYKNVQHLTDTFVSRDRYGMVGDAASIIDAYYSQGMSHSFLTAWHLTNIIEEDLRNGRLDGVYIDRANESLREDWRMIRNMVRGKFTAAISDSRFFLLTHLLDMVLFFSIGSVKSQITRWLVETGAPRPKSKQYIESFEAIWLSDSFIRRPFGPCRPCDCNACRDICSG